MRKAKPRQVKEIVHRGAGIKVPLMFDPNEDSLEFSAVLGESAAGMQPTRFSGKSAEEVCRAVYTYIDTNTALDWIPVIEICELHPFCSSSGHFIGFDVKRYYLANTASRDIRRLEWHWAEDVEEKQKWLIHSGEFHCWHKPIKGGLPHTIGRDSEQVHWIEYDEASWLALIKVQESITLLKDKMRELVRSDSGRERLMEFGAKLARMLPESTH